MADSPVFIDLETRSACELRDTGGHVYAKHPTTRLLTAAWRVDGQYHVWLPGQDEVPEAQKKLHLDGVTVHTGPQVPPPSALPRDRLWVGHNCWGFDEHVWRALGYPEPKKWWDTQALAAACGLPQGLQQIGKRLWGEGKYAEGSRAMKAASKCKGLADCDAQNVPLGTTVLVARYNVQDVRLTGDLWDVLDAQLHLTPFERRVQAVHRAINNRGCRIDTGLLSALYTLSNAAVDDAVARISDLTGGLFSSIGDLRKRTAILAWVKDKGYDLGESLRKEIVNRWVEAAEGGEIEPDEDDPDADGVVGRATNLTLICEVLTLRQAAMRITNAKLESAGQRVDSLGVIRGLFAYWAAGPGRWAGRGVQVQNLPRPKEGVPTWHLVSLFCKTGKLDPAAVKKLLAADTKRANAVRRATHDSLVASGILGRDAKFTPLKQPTLDDAASGLIRSLFIPHAGCVRAGRVAPGILAADFSSIEAVVLAWLAGEQWLMDAFWQRKDPYIEFCRRVTGETITKKDPRRQLWKVVLLGAGYQLGGLKMTAYAAAQGLNLHDYGVTGEGVIDAYRDANPAIAGVVAGEFEGRKWRRGGFWNDLNDAALACVLDGKTVQVGRVTYYRESGHMYCVLPSKREIVYRNARVVRKLMRWGKWVDTVQYDSPRFRTIDLYGGIECENVVQGTASDFLRVALVNLEDAGFEPVMHVHDEPIAQGYESDEHEFMRNVTLLPEWAPDFPLTAEGGWAPRYAKSAPPGRKELVYRNGERL